MCDNLFEDTGDERFILQKTWEKIVEGINKDGYREGLDVGQEESLQEGFNEAFRIASSLLYRVAKLRGIVSAKLSFQLMKPASFSTSQEGHLQSLLTDIVLYEKELLTFCTEKYQADALKSTERPDRIQCASTTLVSNDKDSMNNDKDDLGPLNIDAVTSLNKRLISDELLERNVMDKNLEASVLSSSSAVCSGTDNNVISNSSKYQIDEFYKRLKSILAT